MYENLIQAFNRLSDAINKLNAGLLKIQFKNHMQQLRLGNDICATSPSADAARRTFALRSRCHDQLVDAPAFLGDPLWVQKSLSRMRHASISIYPTKLPK